MTSLLTYVAITIQATATSCDIYRRFEDYSIFFVKYTGTDDRVLSAYGCWG